MESWELYYLGVIRREKRGVGPTFLRLLLWFFSFPFRMIVFLRNSAYDRGLFSRYVPPIPVVISIGNIVTGGAGKTPATLLLANFFYKEFPIAILSRGYRSEAEKLAKPVVLSRGFGPLHPASYGGDEPYLISERLPEAIVVVGKNRNRAADMAARLGAKVVFLDDGMQHRRIERDFEVVVMDVNDPWGLGHFLPLGLLREGKSALKRADLIILNHGEDKSEVKKIKDELSLSTSAVIITTEVEVEAIVDGNKGHVLQREGKIALFSGIAKPENFVSTMKKMGFNPIGKTISNDHEQIDVTHLKRWAEEMGEMGAEALVCTEKDWVKLPLHLSLALPIWWVKVDLRITEGEEELQRLIEKIKVLLRKAT